MVFSLSCGCRSSKSVSVSDGSDRSTASPRRPRDPPSSSADTLMLASPYFLEDDSDSPNTPNFSGLLRQLGDLERNVRALKRTEEKEEALPRHRRCRSDCGSGRVDESVAVVTETADPLGDFRRSMLQMIVEKEIVEGEDLRELLCRFLALNSPRHHDLILRAFADIWADVFSGLERTPDLLRRHRPPPLTTHHTNGGGTRAFVQFSNY